MCLIIVKPKGQTVPMEHVQNAYESNPDGIGISIRNGKPELEIRKYLSLKQFKAENAYLLDDIEAELVIHLRYGTHGSATLPNVHPFMTTHGHAFHHNGIFNIETEPDRTDSEAYKKAYFDTWFDSIEEHVKWIEPDLGGSKIALHTPSGVILYNEKGGSWVNGCWYSNDGYMKRQWLSAWDNEFSSKAYKADTFDEIYWYLEDNLPDHDIRMKNEILAMVEEYMDAITLEELCE